MAQENSADDLEVARILRMLPHLVWEAQHLRPCTHNLRWGATKRRSAGNDEARPPPTHSPAAAPTPPRPRPPHHPAAPPPAVGEPIKKRGGHPTKRCPAATALEEKAAAAAAVPAGRCSNPAVTETSSPETPLDLCLSSEEPDAKANPGPPVEGQTPTKKPKSNHSELAKRVDLLVHTTRTELQRREQRQRQLLFRGRWPPTCTVGSFPGGAPHDQVHRHNQRHQAEQQCRWPNQWVHTPPPVPQPTPPSRDDPETTPPPGGRKQEESNWAAAFRPLDLAGIQGGSRHCNVPDLNAGVEEDLAGS